MEQKIGHGCNGVAGLRERKAQLRRSHADPWTLPDILAGVTQQCAAYPSACKLRGNVNGVNTSLAAAFSGALLQQALALIPTQLLPALAPMGWCQYLPRGRTVDQYGNGFLGAVTQNSGPRENGP
ncbi:hypothetical protein B0A49_03089 [Cryomyces minteri]|uniref:Uncharacterized protein n=1 Tax=Cryomyces minteri TaxID=331657 RepID=A0A4U0XRY1_9PEZI|nr:hypothetical protein B0A49_03089 [Cryomyces minteri]